MAYIGRGLLTSAIALAVALGATPSASATASDIHASATKPFRYSSCAKLHDRFPHGVGIAGAVDKGKSKHKVPNFTRNKAWYLKNKGLDRDHDGIACEA